MLKKSLLYLLILTFLLLSVGQKPVHSSASPETIYPGDLLLKIKPSQTEAEKSYQLWCFANQSIELIFPSLSSSAIFHANVSEGLEQKREGNQLTIRYSPTEDHYLQFWLEGSPENTKLKYKYKDPHQAFLSFARMYAQYSYPWQRRFYLDYYITPIERNQRKYPDSAYQESYLVSLGAPYSWGGKQGLTTIHQKLLRNGLVAWWSEYYQRKTTMHPVNLDAFESCFDYIPGPENPQYWAGVDCSGLLEICCELSGLSYSWREAKLIATGDYRGSANFAQIQAGDIFVLKRDGIVVHFGAISRKGPTVSTTSIIHSAWFTSFRYNTNALLKVAETSLGEFRSFYTWEIRRYHAR
jgi:hypothetical protein